VATPRRDVISVLALLPKAFYNRPFPGFVDLKIPVVHYERLGVVFPNFCRMIFFFFSFPVFFSSSTGGNTLDRAYTFLLCGFFVPTNIFTHFLAVFFNLSLRQEGVVFLR